MKVENAVALVTGANRGLGAAFVRGLLAAGARKVYAAARNPESVALLGATPIRLDVTNPAEIVAAALQCGDVNLLINNAGISRGGGFLKAGAIESARAEMETNYFGPLGVSREFAPILARNGGGAIVNVLSVLSWLTFPSVAGYSASKAAAWSLTNGLRNELREQGAQVIGVHVGYMDTDMASHVEGPKVRPEDVVRQVLETLEAGGEEVLADELSRNVRKGLAADPAIYLSAPRR